VPPHRRMPPPRFDPLDALPLRERAPEEEGATPGDLDPTDCRRDTGPTEAQHHRGGDNALFARSIPARCPPRRDDPRMSGYDHTRFRQLRSGFSGWCSPLPGELNELLLENSIVECAHSWFAGKTMRQIAAATARWEPDADPSFVRIFQKGQWIKKLEARGADVKKSQVVMQVCMYKTFRDAVYAHYFQSVIMAHKHDNVLLNTAMDPSQVQEWYDQHWRTRGSVTTNDYTGWDTGMDRVFLHFDCWMMAQAGIPESYISVFFDERVGSRSFVGPLPIMQFSGDRWTWILNSTRNASVTNATFAIPPTSAQAYGGDDMAVEGRPRMRPSFRPSAWSIAPKTQRGRVLDFCGLSFGGPSLVMSAAAVVYRARLVLQRGARNPDVWSSLNDAMRLCDPSPFQLGLYHRIFSIATSLYGSSIPPPCA
jgi:hypothetical protein